MKNKRAFTLLELMVAMGIIAILAAMSVFGISIVQRSLRNTTRRKALEDLNLAINQYYESRGTYPASGVGGLVLYSDRAEIDGETVVQYSGAATPIDSVLPTNSDGAQYCYIPSGASYRLGVSLEGNDWGLQLGDPNLPDCETIYPVN